MLTYPVTNVGKVQNLPVKCFHLAQIRKGKFITNEGNMCPRIMLQD